MHVATTSILRDKLVTGVQTCALPIFYDDYMWSMILVYDGYMWFMILIYDDFVYIGYCVHVIYEKLCIDGILYIWCGVPIIYMVYVYVIEEKKRHWVLIGCDNQSSVCIERTMVEVSIN